MARRAWLFGLLAAIPVAAQEPADPPPGPDTFDPRYKVTLSQSDIMEVVLAHRKEVSDCVISHRKAEPQVTGKLLMRWKVMRSGETVGVEVASPEFAKTTVAKCMTGVINRLKFPAHQKLGEPITFPFKF